MLTLLQGSMNNFAAPALAAVVIEFYYTGPLALGPVFPEIFGCEAPKVAVCLVATAVMFSSLLCFMDD